MGPQSRHRSVFSRMETDDEYRARLIAAGVEPWKVRDASARGLDALGDLRDLQRRIVEDVA